MLIAKDAECTQTAPIDGRRLHLYRAFLLQRDTANDAVGSGTAVMDQCFYKLILSYMEPLHHFSSAAQFPFFSQFKSFLKEIWYDNKVLCTGLQCRNPWEKQVGIGIPDYTDSQFVQSSLLPQQLEGG